MRIPALALALAALAIGGTAADARSINARQVNQLRRIDAGERSGKLTHREVARLRAEQHSIEMLHDRLKMRGHGHLTQADENLIHARQDAADRHILHRKYNAVRGKNHLKL